MNRFRIGDRVKLRPGHPLDSIGTGHPVTVVAVAHGMRVTVEWPSETDPDYPIRLTVPEAALMKDRTS